MSPQETLISIAKTDLPLQGKLDVFKTEFETRLAPPSVVDVLHRATDELVASGAQANALKVGDKAPDFALPDADGNTVFSKTLLAKGPLVLTFFRGAWCPYCNLDMMALEKARLAIEARGASLVAISQQTQPNSRHTQRHMGLGFPILSDKGGEIGAKFGVRWTLPHYLRQVHQSLGADLSQFNGEDSWTLPMPARFVVGQDGTIAYAERGLHTQARAFGGLSCPRSVTPEGCGVIAYDRFGLFRCPQLTAAPQRHIRYAVTSHVRET